MLLMQTDNQVELIHAPAIEGSEMRIEQTNNCKIPYREQFGLFERSITFANVTLTP